MGDSTAFTLNNICKHFKVLYVCFTNGTEFSPLSWENYNGYRDHFGENEGNIMAYAHGKLNVCGWISAF